MATGQPKRAAWTALPGGDLMNGLAQAVWANRALGRQALIVAPSERLVAQIADRLAKVARVGRLVAGDGPEARLEGYWAAASGECDVLVGTRAAVFAPLARPGLLVLVNDGDPALREPHAPYPHARTVLTVRAGQDRACLLLAGMSRSVEAQALVESGWLGSVSPGRAAVRAATPLVGAPTAADLGWEGVTGMTRLPGVAFKAIREGLDRGPVLIQVPSATHQAFGLVRTADELARSFPAVTMKRSGGQFGPHGTVSPEPALVVATPGAEPAAEGGYAAALLLDAGAWAARAELDAAVDALRIWLGAAGLVRADGKVVLLGSDGATAAQALVRWDPIGLAERELAERRELGLPPATKAIALTGSLSAAQDLLGRIDLPEGTRTLPGESRTVLLVPLDQARRVIGEIRAAVRTRAIERPPDRLRVQVDGELG
jgi:primosomal protein N' (replication factor Y)